MVALAWFAAAPAVSATALLPGDAARGKALHQAQCTTCHDSAVYTRPDRRVKTVEGLLAQVQFCNRNLGGKLSREQVNDLVQYLNQTYYKFE
jgi:mono/diheme cytochrome c family protein